jgi:predicted nucleotidyltransferase
MRLSQQDIQIIKQSLSKYIDDAKITLFGSRVYDHKRGGDIDLFIETNRPVTLREKLKILTDMELSGIERKVDLIIKMPNSKESPLFKTIQEEGITL